MLFEQNGKHKQQQIFGIFLFEMNHREAHAGRHPTQLAQQKTIKRTET